MMIKVNGYAPILRVHAVDGTSIKALARQFHHLRNIREILVNSEPAP
jgi:hypothetical protein